jgi:hypothetical protein
LSSAILYLAIVAIWACVLVPRWLRRSHEQPSGTEVLPAEDEAGQAEMADPGEVAEGDAGTPGTPGTPGFATLREQDAAAYGDPVAWEDPAAPATPDGSVDASYSVTATYAAEVTYSTGTADSGTPAGPVARGGRVSAHGPSPHVVQARRRTLTLLITITVAAMGSAFVGLTPWWTAVPPFVMLGGYLMLLREAAHADAEHARGWAEAHARAARAAELARRRSSQAPVAPVPQPTAEIIDISALAAQSGDQLYDQYADAEIRAVGD